MAPDRLAPCPRPPATTLQQTESGFAAHLRAAIALNKARKPIYEKLSQGRSRELSSRLIRQERIALLAAWYFDWRARAFQREGIPIITRDFVPMTRVKPPATPPRLTGIASPQDLAAAREVARQFRDRLGQALARGDFQAAAAAAERSRGKIEEIERRSGANFAMTRHMIDSIGFGAVNASEYAAASGGRTVGLSRQFLGVQGWGLSTSVETDRMAQEIHHLGVGILENDIPDIPFGPAGMASDPPSEAKSPGAAGAGPVVPPSP